MKKNRLGKSVEKANKEITLLSYHLINHINSSLIVDMNWHYIDKWHWRNCSKSPKKRADELCMWCVPKLKIKSWLIVTLSLHLTSFLRSWLLSDFKEEICCTFLKFSASCRSNLKTCKICRKDVHIAAETKDFRNQTKTFYPVVY